MIKMQIEVAMGENDAEEFLRVIRDWHRRAQGHHDMTVFIIGTARSQEEIEALVKRLGLDSARVLRAPMEMGKATVH